MRQGVRRAALALVLIGTLASASANPNSSLSLMFIVCGEDVSGVGLERHADGAQLVLQLTETSSEDLARLTGNYRGARLHVMADDVVVSSATIGERISNGRVASMTLEATEAEALLADVQDRLANAPCNPGL
jgi:preprotein translocase subunit SecD